MTVREQFVDGMTVVDRDGQKLGRVLTSGRAHFEIERGFFFRHIHLVSYADVERVEADTVHLTLPQSALEELWAAQEDYVEPGERRRAIDEARGRALDGGGKGPSGPLM